MKLLQRRKQILVKPLPSPSRTLPISAVNVRTQKNHNQSDQQKKNELDAKISFRKYSIT